MFGIFELFSSFIQIFKHCCDDKNKRILHVIKNVISREIDSSVYRIEAIAVEIS